MKREVELAKKLLEGKGYKVSKKMNESLDPSDLVYDAISDLGIEYESISEDDGVVYVERDNPFSSQELNNVWDHLRSAESSGFEDGNKTMWFAFSDDIKESETIYITKPDDLVGHNPKFRVTYSANPGETTSMTIEATDENSVKAIISGRFRRRGKTPPKFLSITKVEESTDESKKLKESNINLNSAEYSDIDQVEAISYMYGIDVKKAREELDSGRYTPTEIKRALVYKFIVNDQPTPLSGREKNELFTQLCKEYGLDKNIDESYNYSGHDVSDDLQDFLVTICIGYSDGDGESGMTEPECYQVLVSAMDEDDARRQAEKGLDPDDGITDIHLATEEERSEWYDTQDCEYSPFDTMTESASEQFQSLLKKADNSTLDVLKKIAQDIGISPDESPTEEEAQQILNVYNGKNSSEEYASPARNSDSTRAEKLSYARDLLSKAKSDNDVEAAWKLIDFLHDTMLLSESSRARMKESIRSRVSESKGLDYDDMKYWNDVAIASHLYDEFGDDMESINRALDQILTDEYRSINWDDDEDTIAKKLSDVRSKILHHIQREAKWDNERKSNDPMNGHKYQIGGSTPNVTETGTDYDVHDGGYKEDPKSAILAWLQLSQKNPTMISIDTNKNSYAQELLQWVVDNEDEFRSLCARYKCPYKVDYMIDGCKKKLERPSNFETKYNYPDQIYPFALG